MKELLTLTVLLVFASSVEGQTERQTQNAPLLTARQIAQRTFPSVVVLETEDSRGNPIALGSGFFVQEDVVATNYHVIEDASRIYAKIIGQEIVYDVAGTVGFNKADDLALLKITGVKARPLELGNVYEFEVGDTVYAVGNPEGLEGTFSQGIVSALRGRTLIQITAPISHGSSGGPVLNQRGEVVGIAVSGFKEGQNLNFAISVSKLRSLIGGMTATVRPLSTITPSVKSNAQTNPRPIYGPSAPSPFPIRKDMPSWPRPPCGDTIFPDEMLGKENFKKLMKAGDEYLRTGKYGYAIELFNHAAYLKPSSAEAYYKLSLAFLGNGEGCLADAIAAAKRAVASDPKKLIYLKHLDDTNK